MEKHRKINVFCNFGLLALLTAFGVPSLPKLIVLGANLNNLGPTWPGPKPSILTFFREKVKENFGLRLEREVHILGGYTELQGTLFGPALRNARGARERVERGIGSIWAWISEQRS